MPVSAAPTVAYLSLGSNRGERRENLRRACAALEGKGIHLRRASSLYETEPVDFPDQDWFLNCVVEIETTLSPFQLLDELQKIEQDLGRRRTRPKGPRTIDLDILLYGDGVVSEERLVLPHPRMHTRRFVLEPLREIAPALPLPGLGRTVESLCADLRDPAVVRRLPDRCRSGPAEGFLP